MNLRDCKTCKGTGKVKDTKRPSDVWDEWPDIWDLANEVQQHIETLDLPSDRRRSSEWLLWEAISDFLDSRYKVTERMLVRKTNELVKMVHTA